MADIRFSEATDAAPPLGTDIIGMERPGSPATAVRTTLAEVLALASGGALPAPPGVDGDYVLGVADTGATLSWDTLAAGGGALDDLSDVNIPSPAGGQVPSWDAAESKYVARFVPQFGGLREMTGSGSVVTADRNGTILANSASDLTITVPDGLGWLANEHLTIRQVGAGQVTIAQGGTATVASPETLKSAKQNAQIVLTCEGGDGFALGGYLELAE